MTFWCMSMRCCVVQAAHLHAQSCGALVHHSSVEEFGVRKRGPDGTSTKKLRVRCVVHNVSIRHFLSTMFTYSNNRLQGTSGQDDKAWLPTNVSFHNIRGRHEDGHQGMLDSLCSPACCQAPPYLKYGWRMCYGTPNPSWQTLSWHNFLLGR